MNELLKDWLIEHNYYPEVVVGGGLINVDIRNKIPNLNEYDGVFAAYDDPSPIYGYRGTQFRTAFFVNAPYYANVFFDRDYSGLSVYEPADYTDVPTSNFVGTVFYREPGVVYQQYEDRLARVVELAMMGGIVKINKAVLHDRESYSRRCCSQEEYDSIVKSTQYTLCPRGCANYSFRFYETLALGRIPIYPDCGGPLIEGVDWRNEIVWVERDADIKTALNEFHSQFTDDKSFRSHQRRMREIYDANCSFEAQAKKIISGTFF